MGLESKADERLAVPRHSCPAGIARLNAKSAGLLTLHPRVASSRRNRLSAPRLTYHLNFSQAVPAQFLMNRVTVNPITICAD